MTFFFDSFSPKFSEYLIFVNGREPLVLNKKRTKRKKMPELSRDAVLGSVWPESSPSCFIISESLSYLL